MHLKRAVTISTVSAVCIIIFLIYQNQIDSSKLQHANDLDLSVALKKSQIINFGNIEYEIKTTCIATKIIWLVTSYAGNSNKRNALRLAYTKKELGSLGIQRIFLLGKFSHEHADEQYNVDDESSIFEDIIQGNFTEAYRNLTYKHLMGLSWVSENCHSADFVIKMDDDIVINLYEVMSKLKNMTNIIGGLAIMGYTLENQRPMRSPENKWFVTKSEFNDEIYPNFVSGWFYITNPNTARRLVDQSRQHEQYFWIDDVFITGILRNESNIPIIDIHEFYATDYRFLDCCVEGIRMKFKCEFIAGPDGAQDKLLHRFKKYGEFCRDNKCSDHFVGKTCVTVYKEPTFDGPGIASVKIIKP